MVKVKDIVSRFEEFAPKWMAEDGDPVGLQLGDLNQEVHKMMVTLDVRPETVQEAIDQHVDFIFAHHPAMFRPVQPFDLSIPQNQMYAELIKHNITVYGAHTNLDNANGGMNDWLADLFDLQDTVPMMPTREEKMYKLAVFTQSNTADSMRHALNAAGAGNLANYRDCSYSLTGTSRFIPRDDEHSYSGDDKDEMVEVVQEKIEVFFPARIKDRVLKAMKDNHPQEDFMYDLHEVNGLGQEYGMGRVGNLPEPMTVKEFALKCEEVFDIPGVRVISKDIDQKVQRIALLGGSGARFYPQALSKNADLYLTGDVSYHVGHDILASGMSAVDAGHYIESECKPHLTKLFQKWSQENDWQIDIYQSKLNTNPYQFM